jgi:hypothetical protein
MADTETQPPQVRLVPSPLQPDEPPHLADQASRPRASEVDTLTGQSRPRRPDMDFPVPVPPPAPVVGPPRAAELVGPEPSLAGGVGEIHAEGFQVYYEPSNPYDADLHLTMPNGSIAVLALPPMDLAMLTTQLEEVRTSQKRMQHEIDGGHPDDFDTSTSWQPVNVYGDEHATADAGEIDSADRGQNEDRPLPERIARKAVDPYSFLGLLDMVPPIAGHSGKTVVTVAVLAALVLSAFVGIVLV